MISSHPQTPPAAARAQSPAIQMSVPTPVPVAPGSPVSTRTVPVVSISTRPVTHTLAFASGYFPKIDYEGYKARMTPLERRKYLEGVMLKNLNPTNKFMSTNTKCLILSDLFFYALEFALYECKFTSEQTSVFIKLLSNFHAEACANRPASPEGKSEGVKEKESGSMSNTTGSTGIINVAHDKLHKELLAKSVEYPPDQVRIFSLKEMDEVINYIYNTYSRTLLFYRVTFLQ